MPPPLPVQPKEETIYSDNAIVVTNMRIMIGGATYALRNVTSVKKMFTPPQLGSPILVLLGGISILLLTTIPFNQAITSRLLAAGLAAASLLAALSGCAASKPNSTLTFQRQPVKFIF